MVNSAVKLLKQIIAIPSLTFEEERVAGFICNWLEQQGEELKGRYNKTSAGFKIVRIKNNITVLPDEIDPSLPTLMLNAHIDTVKPAESYTVDPH